MSSNHTPGPWKADFKAIGLVKAENGAEIAKCKRLTSLVELEARTRLVAAAPEMLDALESISSHFDMDEYDREAWKRLALEMAEVARTAIAKATGAKP